MTSPQYPVPNPQSPVPSPQSPITQIFLKNLSFWYNSLVFLRKWIKKKEGERFMAKVQNSPVPSTGAKPPYTFRTAWALLLLAVNFLVAAYYFHIIE
jgi:photosystem I 4.8kDa protein